MSAFFKASAYKCYLIEETLFGAKYNDPNKIVYGYDESSRKSINITVVMISFLF